MSKSILFLYTGGRLNRITESEDHYAKDFFYGYHEFKELGYDVDFVERIIPDIKPNNLRYKWLAFHNEWAARHLTMGNNAPFFLPHIEKLKHADIIIAIGDSIALAPEYYKLRGWIKAKIIHVSMGFVNYWSNAKVSDFKKSTILKWYYQRLLKQADAIITLGVAETERFIIEFPKLKSKIHFVPFGVDLKFWKPNPSTEMTNDILFIGNDLRRDYKLLELLPEYFPDRKFIYVSKRLSEAILSKFKNVNYFSGSWRSVELTDCDIRDLYQKSKVLINPITETLQPSGQSVTLQAMACGLPVIISKFKGFWQPSSYNVGNIRFTDHTLIDWINAINELLNNESERNKLAGNGLKLTQANYSSAKMIINYQSLINQLSTND